MSDPQLPEATAADPTAGGYYCGAPRKPSRIALDIAAGRDGWPYCRARAGHGTGHSGHGVCKWHGGSLPVVEASWSRRIDDAARTAFGNLLNVLRDATDDTDPDRLVPNRRLRVTIAQDLMDRAGYGKHSTIHTGDEDQIVADLMQRLDLLESYDQTDD